MPVKLSEERSGARVLPAHASGAERRAGQQVHGRRYARHVLLPEVGVDGQARLSAHAVSLEGEPRAVETAALYLSRAGVGVGAGDEVRVCTGALAGRPELAEAAAFVAGAFAAVEEIKRVLGVGRPASLDGAPPLDGPVSSARLRERQ